MAENMLPGEKRIRRETVRLEETEAEMLLEEAAQQGVSRSTILREGLRMRLNLLPPEDEVVPNWTPKAPRGRSY